ncbi:DNA-binding helix-turn-helix protein [Weissella kandleri]|uniref:DNA-binding helix-turn-helix protein n=1 Tax=Weissella kandleri TaxID=1616 RepID=A0A0R2JD28_9LACO|nr:helix-turn-helix transcriptional regulator [Weissella kandleri]KRN75251.1 DNA-binding helix-turn-helix protein [Weissella kandleri]
MKFELGPIIKKERKLKHISQQELSEGICSQAMLSSIENNKYIPNINLFLKLCKRLDISLDDISLTNNFDISEFDNINKKISMLCNNHDYRKLKLFLLNESTVNGLKTDKQLQAYYYYLGVAELNDGNNMKNAVNNFKLSLACESGNTNSCLFILAKCSIGYVYSLQGKSHIVMGLLKETLRLIDSVKYEENLNIIYYVVALSYYRLGKYQNSLECIELGIKFITNHNSHYMLANSYRLLAETSNNNIDLHNKSDFLSQLFSEPVFDKY